MKKLYRILSMTVAFAAMILCLQAQDMLQTEAGRTPVVASPEQILQQELEAFARAKSHPLTNSKCEIYKVGDVTWARANGETEFYLAPTTIDPPAYFSRIMALDNRQEGNVKSTFRITKLILNNQVRQMLAQMGIIIPDYYKDNQICVMLPQIDIDQLLQANADISVIENYGTNPVVFDDSGSGSKEVIWTEGWEGALTNYTIGNVSGSANTTWGKVSCDKHAGSWGLWCAAAGTLPQPHCGSYASNMNTYVYKTTGIYVLPYTNVKFYWWQKYQTETGYDYFKFLYSSNGTNWTVHLNFDGNSIDYPAWKQWVVSFNGFSTMYWRFDFTSDNIYHYAGAFIDDLEITGDPGCTSSSQFPAATLVPESNWKTQSSIYAGEYARFSVVNGTVYQWSLCTEHCGLASYDSELTLRRADNDQILAYANDICGDDARITWTANFTGEVKVVITKFSCQSQTTSTRLAYKTGALEDATLSVSPANRSVSYFTTSTTFDVTSNGTWSISGWPAWVTSVTPASGSGNQTITVTFEPNNTGGPQRIATLNASLACGTPVSFTITQASDPGCTSSTQYGTTNTPTENWKYLSSMYAGEYALFTVTSGVQYHWSLCPEQGGDASYDSQLTLRRSDDTYITYSNNSCGDDARISWTANFTGTVKVILMQNNCLSNTVITRLGYKSGALINPALSISPVSRFVDAFEGSTTFSITSNTSWTLSGWPAWMTVSQASGSGNATITVVYGLNSGNSGRTGTITVSAPGVTNVLFTLNQGYKCNSTSQYPSSTLTPASYWKYQGAIYAGEYSLHSVVYGVTYHWSLCPTHGGNAPSYEPELTLRNAATDELLAYANLNCSNPIYNGATISWTATFTGNVKVVVTEYNCNTNSVYTCLAYKSGTLTNAALAVSPANQSVSYNSGSTTFSLTANGAWLITGWPAWITSVSPTMGTGNATITVSYSANNTGGPTRMATINATMGCLLSESFTVTQDSDPGCNSSTLFTTTTPNANWKTLLIYPGEYSIFPVVSGTQYHWSLCAEHCGVASYNSELTLRRASDDLYLGYSNDVCGDDARLSWTATFTGDVKVIVSKYHCQSDGLLSRLAYKSGALEAPTLSVSPANRNVSAGAGSTTFTITSNASWSIAGVPAWITSVTPSTSGVGNTTITVNYALNASGVQRVALLEAYLACGATVPFSLTQGEAATSCPSYNFAITPSYVWQTHSSSHGTFSGKMYRMTVVGGRTYSFKTGCEDGATADYDTFLEIYDAGCNLIFSSDDGCENWRSRMDWTADYDGYAYLKVRGFSGFWGSYTLAYRAEGCPNSVMFTGPHNITDDWNWVTGIYAGEHSTFNVTQGVQYHWSLCPEHCGNASYDSELTLRKHDDGSFIAFADNVCGNDARISWTATFTGQVRVMVTKFPCTSIAISSALAYKSGNLTAPNFNISPISTQYLPASAGSITFNITSNVPWLISGIPLWITSVSPASGTGDAVVTVEYAANATGIQREAILNFVPGCGSTVNRTIIQGEANTVCPSYDYTLNPGTSWQLHAWSHGVYSSKLYRVNVSSNNRYTFKTGCGDGATANYDTRLSLYDAGCNLIAENDDGCEENRSTITWSSSITGYIYLKVSGWSIHYGNYTLAMRRCSLPAVPGTIAGNATPCQGTGNTYSVSPVSGATSYIWTLPAGWSGSSTSNAIVATAGATGGSIKVRAVNDCGEGFDRTLVVSVLAIPAQPGAIGGPASVFNGGSYTYSVAAVSGASAYSWTLPAGWSGTSTTNSITATAGASSGLISVTASNECGTSPARSLTVTSTTVPASLTLQNTIINPGVLVCFNALQTITLAGSGTHFTVMNTGRVELVAGQKISMLPGTSVYPGGYLLGRIASAYNYCTPPAAKDLPEYSPVPELPLNVENSVFSLYPNPNIGTFTLEQKPTEYEGDLYVEIFTVRGERVYQAILPDRKKNEFRMEHLMNGMYILKIRKEDHFETFKLVIAR